MKKQFLVDVTALAGGDLKTGIQRVVRSVLMDLLEHPPMGYRVEPVCIADINGVWSYRYASMFTHGFTEHTEIRYQQGDDTLVRVTRGDLFLGLDLCHTIINNPAYFLAIRELGCRVFFIVYDLLPLRFPNFFPPGVAETHSAWMRTVAQSDGVLCISRAVADEVNNWMFLNAPEREHPFWIGWFHLGQDIETSLPTGGLPDGFDVDLRLFASGTTILMVGTVEPRKGYSQVLDSFEELWTEGAATNLAIVGKVGWMVDDLVTRLEKHPEAGRRLFWFRSLSDEALQALYNAADGMIMASEGEGFGLPLVEAAQYGCPLLARDLPVFREVAGNHASWFSGSSGRELAATLRTWLAALRNGSAPTSTGIPAITWRKATARIVGLLEDTGHDGWVFRLDPPSPPERRTRTTPRCIAVDLTFVQTSGSNGGAKVFLLELIRILSRMKPKTRFIMLTNQYSHDELAFLDRRNVQRIMVMGDPATAMEAHKKQNSITFWAEKTARRWKRSLDKRLGKRKLLTPIPGMSLRDLGVDLFYSPFTSLDRAEPGIPSVCTFYDLQHKTYPRFFLPEEVDNRDRMFLDVCRNATAIAAISEYSRLSAIAHGCIDPSRIRTIHIRMALRVASPSRWHRNDVLGRSGLQSGSYLLYPANFWFHKNHELLLEAFAQAIGKGLDPELKLVCTGTPCERRDSVMETARNMGMDHKVVFPGYVPQQDLATLLANCRGMVFPSLYEGFGMPVIEAMAAGIPVACSNTRALPEVTDGAALLFDPTSAEAVAEAICTLSENETVRRKLAKAGRIRARKFADDKQMALEYWQLFEETLATALSSENP